MHKRLFRIRENKILGGVCTGIGEYFDIDPVLVRVAFIVFGLLHGLGILLYIILWIVVPEKNGTPNFKGKNASFDNENSEVKETKTNGRIIAGFFLIIIGLLFLSERFFPGLGPQEILSLILIIIGTIILWDAFKR